MPGGFTNPDLLRQSADVRAFVRDFERLARPIAAICHGPQVLISAGLVAGRKLASWPGIADDVKNAGASWVDEPVVHDGRWVTSRGPQDVAAFSAAAIDLFEATAPRELAPASRRARWGATGGQVGAYALAGAAAVAAWEGLRRRRWPGLAELGLERRRSAASPPALAAELVGVGALAFAGWTTWRSVRQMMRAKAQAGVPAEPPPPRQPSAVELRERGRSYAPGALGVTVGAGADNSVDLPSRSR
ncbi:MAG: DJ-1/PfpI family protein [Anaeromyxobacter sp.]